MKTIINPQYQPHAMAAKQRNFQLRSFRSTSRAASLVLTKTTAEAALVAAESRPRSVPNKALGLAGSWWAGPVAWLVKVGWLIG